MATKTNKSQKEMAAAAKKSLNNKTWGENLQDVNFYAKGWTMGELRAARVTLAKRANQRLVRLERASSAVTGESFASYGAAEKAYDYIEGSRYKDIEKNEPGTIRFSENFGYTAESAWDIKKEIVVLQTFLSSKSSTVVGQKAIERKRIKTFESGQYGVGKNNAAVPIKFASNKEFYNFLNSKTFEGLKASGFNSEDIVDKYVRTAEKEDSLEEASKKMSEALDSFRSGEVDANIKNLDKVLENSKNT